MTQQSHPWANILRKQKFKKYTYPYVHSSTMHNSQDAETTQISTDTWMDRDDVVYIHSGILLHSEKEWNDAICNNMDDLEIIILSKPRQTETNIIWYHLYMESKKLYR